MQSLMISWRSIPSSFESSSGVRWLAIRTSSDQQKSPLAEIAEPGSQVVRLSMRDSMGPLPNLAHRSGEYRRAVTSATTLDGTGRGAGRGPAALRRRRGPAGRARCTGSAARRRTGSPWPAALVGSCTASSRSIFPATAARRRRPRGADDRGGSRTRSRTRSRRARRRAGDRRRALVRRARRRCGSRSRHPDLVGRAAAGRRRRESARRRAASRLDRRGDDLRAAGPVVAPFRHRCVVTAPGSAAPSSGPGSWPTRRALSGGADARLPGRASTSTSTRAIAGRAMVADDPRAELEHVRVPGARPLGRTRRAAAARRRLRVRTAAAARRCA